MQDDYLQRFSGCQRVYGQHVMEKLQQAHVVIIGIGGVGVWIAEALARSGVGKLTLIDHDDIALSNINRQLHTLDSTLEQSKVKVMQQRIIEINPACECHIVDDFITQTNVIRYLDQRYHLVLDAIDQVVFKAAIIVHCKRHKIPIISLGGAGGQIDPLQIQMSDLSKTYNDPLLAKVRNYLRREYHFTRNPKRRFGVPCIFSSEPLRYPQKGGEVSQQKVSLPAGTTLDCATGFGASVCVTASFGFIAAAKAIEKLSLR